jgi:hypothetical protein
MAAFNAILLANENGRGLSTRLLIFLTVFIGDSLMLVGSAASITGRF